MQHACPTRRTAALRGGGFAVPLPPQQQEEQRGERLAGVARRMLKISTAWGLALALLHASPDGDMHVRMRSNMVSAAGVGNDSFCEVRRCLLCCQRRPLM